MTDIFWKLYLQQLTVKVWVWHSALGLVVLAYYEKAISVKPLSANVQVSGLVHSHNVHSPKILAKTKVEKLAFCL